MKQYSNVIAKLLLLAIAACFALTVSAQSGGIKEGITSKTFVFRAQTANPSAGPAQQLSAGYELVLKGASIDAYLPYYGRAYSPPVDPTASGIKFMSQNFEYNATERKGGGWEVVIRPKDVTDIRELLLTVFDNGSATLVVNSDRRSPITFNGSVQAYTPKPKAAK